jgi:hypothetical protein
MALPRHSARCAHSSHVHRCRHLHRDCARRCDARPAHTACGSREAPSRAPTYKHTHAHTPMCARWAWLGLAEHGSREATGSAVGRRMCAHTRACCMLQARDLAATSSAVFSELAHEASAPSATAAWVCRAGRAGAKPGGRIRAFPSLRPMSRLHGDWAHPSGVCTGTGLAPCHVCTGTGLSPAASAHGLGSPHATSARGLGSPPRRLHGDWAHPSGICTGTGLAPCHVCTRTGLTPCHV